MSAAGAIAPNTNACDCTNRGEWQVAYFWLVCLALNSMTQPSGRVCDLPTKHRFILRSSPIICAFDGFGVLAIWLWHMFWHLEAPSTAARRIARARFRDVEEEAGEDSLSSLEKNVLFRYTVFLLGALPQAVKLFASSGVPWTQAWGAMYFGSWVVLEALVIFASKGKHNARHPPARLPLKWKRLREWWGGWAAAMHAIL